MPRRYTGKDVFSSAMERLLNVYKEGHRVIVTFSGGKDSGVCLELCIVAARETGNLPVEVIMRDDEIMLPGTFEYCKRVAQREEVDFHWVYANQPCINVFNRTNPYFYCHDPLLKPEQWMSIPPDYAYKIDEMNIDDLVTAEKFPPKEGKLVMVVVGLRTQESINRLLGLYSSKGHITKPMKRKSKLRPIYDWKDGDVWLAHKKFDWDYNSAYDVMARFGYARHCVRIAPPTQAEITVKRDLVLARKAFPKWFDKLCIRLNGIRSASMYGLRAVRPQRNLGESWENVYQRECIDNAPEWIRDRAVLMINKVYKMHRAHSTLPFPDARGCPKCQPNCWKKLCVALYMGDPFCFKVGAQLPYIEPEFFREGAGTWGGRPSF